MRAFTQQPSSNLILVATPDSATRIDVARRIARLGITTLATLDASMAVAAARAHDGHLLGAIIDADPDSPETGYLAHELERAVNDLPLLVLDRSAGDALDATARISRDAERRVSDFLERIVGAVPAEYRAASDS